MAFNRVIQFKRFLKYLCPFLRLYRCCLLAKVHNWGEQTLFRSGKELASITFEFASIYLYPNASFPLSKLEFGALQIPICSSANWTQDYSNRFFKGLIKLFQRLDKFFSSLWKLLKKVCRRILVDIHFCHCHPNYKLLSPEYAGNWLAIFAAFSSEIDFSRFWFTFASVLRPHGRDNDYGEG